MEPLPPNRCPACAAMLPVSEGPDLVCPECGKELRFARSLLEPVLYRTWTAWALSALEQHLRWEAVGHGFNHLGEMTALGYVLAAIFFLQFFHVWPFRA